MKKVFGFFAILFALVALTGCSRVSESYAEKINVAAAKEEYYTYDQIMEDLGEEGQDYTIALLGSHNGFIYAIRGVTSKQEFEELRDSEEEMECLIVTIVNNKATSAKYSTTKDVEK